MVYTFLKPQAPVNQTCVNGVFLRTSFNRRSIYIRCFSEYLHQQDGERLEIKVLVFMVIKVHVTECITSTFFFTILGQQLRSIAMKNKDQLKGGVCSFSLNF